MPYYYADNTYYLWNRGVGQYESVPPPATAPNPAQGPQPAASDLFAYPKAGQSPEQQAQDREECRRWAAEQTGSASAGTTAAPPDYRRAEGACLEARGYSIG